MRAICSARYLPLLDEFTASSDDVRFYLQGIYFEPHESGVGAYLVASDGHRMVVVHDEAAKVDAPLIICPDKLITQQAKGAALADFDGDYCDLQDEEEKLIMRGRCLRIDHKFVDWRTVVPEERPTGEPATLNADLIKAIGKAPWPKGSAKGATFFTDRDKPSVARLNGLPEILIIIMPMRESEPVTSKPEWIRARKATKQPAPEQSPLDLPPGVSVEITMPDGVVGTLSRAQA